MKFYKVIHDVVTSEQDMLNNVEGTGEIFLEMDHLKRIFTIPPLNIKTYFNLDDPNDPQNANVEICIDENYLNSKRYALTPNGGSGNDVLNSILSLGNIANMYGLSPINVSALWEPGSLDHGNLQVSLDETALTSKQDNFK